MLQLDIISPLGAASAAAAADDTVEKEEEEARVSTSYSPPVCLALLLLLSMPAVAAADRYAFCPARTRFSPAAATAMANGSSLMVKV